MKPRILFNSRRSLPIASAIATLLAISPLHAATLHWDGTGDADGGSGTWNLTNFNWDSLDIDGTNSIWSKATPDTATFGGTAGTVTLGSTILAGGLTFNHTTGTYTIAGGSSSNVMSTGGGRITTTAGGTTNIAEPLFQSGATLRYNSSTALATTVNFATGTIAGTNWTGTLSGLTIGAGQTISPGNSPGTATTDSQTWAGLGAFLFEINNATGSAGADHGWDLLSGTGTLDITATSGSKFNILLTSMTLGNLAGDAENFNAATGYNSLFADFTNPITGYAADKFFVNTSAFDNAITGTSGVAFGNTIGVGDNTQLYLTTYSPIPEPRAALLGGLGMLLLLRRRRF